MGLVAPVHDRQGGPVRKRRSGFFSTLTAMTSGNLLSIAAWDAVGRFDEGLFIDHVDHDLCLRMHRLGFAVLRCRDAHIRHRLGDTVKRTFPVTVYVSNHSVLRRYYITRNLFEVTRRFKDDYPKFRVREMSHMRRSLGKILLYEDHKAAKLLMMWRGYRDYRRGVTGRYSG
jgi:rhamnosyltransferase